ncbi:uncharacterized protein LOC112502988 isoform X2 [Cynara cardunculus var. scolymus]|nr:uncharacterized protein LOC112502988 isoform X2 [Cynara cardunculus var. scolymus]XP_024962815.1 uncharacterized protein LOC112502988 isoform X2 [Cynara cardunculus var. scolymus]XP_024962824.1 uncharacterized protein LOC112502988 isoform X2 [Cynara cardunculus var. scolymus]
MTVSAGGDVEHERKAKRKQVERDDVLESESEEDDSSSEGQEDQMEDGSDSESVGGSEDDSSSEELDETTGLISEDVIDTSNKQPPEMQPINDVKEASSNLFQKKFGFDDEEKLLQVMIREGDTHGTQGFWRGQMDSMRLSITVNEVQLYDKTRRLKTWYSKRLRNDSNTLLNNQQFKVFQLCDKIWGKEERENFKDVQSEKKQAVVDHQPHVKKLKKEKKKKEVEQSHVKKVKGKRIASEVTKTRDMEYKHKYYKFVIEYVKKNVVDFPFDEAMEAVPVSIRPSLEKKWWDMNEVMMESYKSLVHEIFEAAKPSSSHV